MGDAPLTGGTGLILETVSGGAKWTMITDPVLTDFHMYGVAFACPVGVAVVGKIGTVGRAFIRVNGNWTDISPDSALNAKVITGVDAIGSVVYAVGAKVNGNGREGTVMKLVGGKLKEVSNNTTVLKCTVGEHASDTEPLNAVKMVGGASNVFVAGQCGVIWELAGST